MLANLIGNIVKISLVGLAVMPAGEALADAIEGAEGLPEGVRDFAESAGDLNDNLADFAADGLNTVGVDKWAGIENGVGVVRELNGNDISGDYGILPEMITRTPEIIGDGLKAGADFLSDPDNRPAAITSAVAGGVAVAYMPRAGQELKEATTGIAAATTGAARTAADTVGRIGTSAKVASGRIGNSAKSFRDTLMAERAAPSSQTAIT